MSPPQEQNASAVEVRIRHFQAGDEASFRSLNEEWISRYFRFEPKDEEVLADPQGNILAMAEGFCWQLWVSDAWAAARFFE
jgi:hypothetical protein